LLRVFLGCLCSAPFIFLFFSNTGKRRNRGKTESCHSNRSRPVTRIAEDTPTTPFGLILLGNGLLVSTPRNENERNQICMKPKNADPQGGRAPGPLRVRQRLGRRGGHPAVLARRPSRGRYRGSLLVREGEPRVSGVITYRTVPYCRTNCCDTDRLSRRRRDVTHCSPALPHHLA